jgi:hypothetical protein
LENLYLTLVAFASALDEALADRRGVSRARVEVEKALTALEDASRTTQYEVVIDASAIWEDVLVVDALRYASAQIEWVKGSNRA